MSKYIDGFVLVVPKDKREEYAKMAEMGKESWMKNGALEYFECRGEDMATKEMGGEKPLTFPEMTKAKENEDVWFSFVVFKSKAHRDEVNAKVVAEMNEAMKDQKDMQMPFEMHKMAYGGFEAVIEG
jgi:uncharacterized protein YbaA (DUF1428 family)